MKTTYTTLDQVKIDTQNGKTVHWKNDGYTVKQSKFEPGDFNVICFNGNCAFLSNDYKPEDFYTTEQ
jgi:hypothetical protein